MGKCGQNVTESQGLKSVLLAALGTVSGEWWVVNGSFSWGHQELESE